MKKLSANLFFIVLLVIIGIAFLYGVLVPQNGLSKPVGNMQLSVFKNGLSLFQQNMPYYYSFSPYNDYFFSKEGVRSSLITAQEIEHHDFTSTFELTHAEAVKETLKGFFDRVSPHITYETKDFKIKYESKTFNNSIIINRQITLKNGNILPILGMTLTYSGADFVYDKFGNLYNFQSEEDINNFEKFYGIHLQYKSDGPRILVPDKTIFIMNPLMSVVLAIQEDNNQSLYINTESKMVEVQDIASWQGNENNSKVTVTVYDNPKEVK